MTKAVLLAGGLGTRFSEETASKPKPMVEIGGKPILWHIMKIYSRNGINEFIICCGYKGHVIKEYFQNYFIRNSDVTYDLKSNSLNVHQNLVESWKVTLVDTGEHTMVGGRIKRIIPYVKNDPYFCLTYGDGLANVNIQETIELHQSSGRLSTVTAVQPPGRFGALKFEGNRVLGFQEKPQGDGGWINGGFFVLSPSIDSYIAGDDTVWEREPLEKLSRDNQLSVYFHRDFWHPMDTLRDHVYLNELWNSGARPWEKSDIS